MSYVPARDSADLWAVLGGLVVTIAGTVAWMGRDALRARLHGPGQDSEPPLADPAETSDDPRP